jgi:hypothetical protein
MVFNPQMDTSISVGQLEELSTALSTLNAQVGTCHVLRAERKLARFPSWTLIAEVQVFPDMNECAGAVMAPGDGITFVARGKAQGHLHDYQYIASSHFSVSDVSNTIVTTLAKAAVVGVPDGYAYSGPKIRRKPSLFVGHFHGKGSHSS